MISSIDAENERDFLLSNFMQAVKLCQVRFGGRTELATEEDSCIGNICNILESILEHGLLASVHNGGTRTIRHMKNLVSSTWNFQATVGSTEGDKAVVWWFIRELLTQHEYNRFLLLKNIVTDVGRSRAWIRSLLNEHSLERYINIILGEEEIINRWYEPWSLLRNQEKVSMLPHLVAGLDTILFAINIDNEALNDRNRIGVAISHKAVSDMEGQKHTATLSASTSEESQDSAIKSYKRKKKKIASQVVCFDHDYSTKLVAPSQLKNISYTSTRTKSTYVSSSINVAETVNKENEHLEIAKDQEKLDCVQVKEATFVSNKCSSFSNRTPVYANNFDECGLPHNLHKDIQPLKTISGSEVGLIPLSPDGEFNDIYIPADSVSLKSYPEDDDTVVHFRDKKNDKVKNTNEREFSPSFSTFKLEELRAAVLEISRSRDLAEEKRNEMSDLLSKEMENTAVLRAQIFHDQAASATSIDHLSAQTKSFTRENELLRHQLKKYVSAVQMLRRDETNTGDSTGEETVLSKNSPDLRDYHDEAIAYEGKLIQVAEMHGELMEFNEGLQKLLRLREYQVQQLREELIELRGPFPDQSTDEVYDDAISIRNDLGDIPAPRTLINIWIPTAFLAGSPVDIHHVYQIYIRIKEDEWNVYRRFAQFYELHTSCKKKYALVKTFDFPKKKTFGYKDIGVVEDRRTRLQEYLRKLINLLLIEYPKMATEPNKLALTEKIPFLIDPPSTTVTISQQSRVQLFPRTSSVGNDQVSPISPQYNGL